MTGERFRVAGFSLLPAVPPGARVELRAPVPPPRPGDLVVVRFGDVRVCHVVVAAVPDRADGRLVTRGLWALADDPPAPPDAVLGVVASVEWLGLRARADGPAFRAWLRAGARLGPGIRRVRSAVWLRLPEPAREVLRRVVGRRRP